MGRRYLGNGVLRRSPVSPTDQLNKYSADSDKTANIQIEVEHSNQLVHFRNLSRDDNQFNRAFSTSTHSVSGISFLQSKSNSVMEDAISDIFG